MILEYQQINKIILKLQKMQEKSWKEEKLADITKLILFINSLDLTLYFMIWYCQC